jgi:predicted nucleic acid-binding protein
LIRYVIDASTAMLWLVERPFSAVARELLIDTETPHFAWPRDLIAPAILPVEVRYALGTLYNRGHAASEQLVMAIPALRKIFGSFEPVDDALLDLASAPSFSLNDGQVAQLDKLSTFGFYDCLYIALARKLDAELVTADLKQGKLARAYDVTVRLIG